MDEREIKNGLLRLIGDAIDEKSLDCTDSFVEMCDDVVHVAVDGRDWYFVMRLEMVVEDGKQADRVLAYRRGVRERP